MKQETCVDAPVETLSEVSVGYRFACDEEDQAWVDVTWRDLTIVTRADLWPSIYFSRARITIDYNRRARQSFSVKPLFPIFWKTIYPQTKEIQYWWVNITNTISSSLLGGGFHEPPSCWNPRFWDSPTDKSRRSISSFETGTGIMRKYLVTRLALKGKHNPYSDRSRCYICCPRLLRYSTWL